MKADGIPDDKIERETLMSNANKVIFLDMDGVVCTHRACVPRDDRGAIFTYLDPVVIDMLNDICEKTGAKIVISSSWRKLTTEMNMVLAAAGLKQCHFFFSKDEKNGGFYTNKFSTKGHSRGHEVDDWLRDHPGIDCYVILDDDSDFLDHQKPFLVQTDSYDGMGYRDYKRALMILGHGDGPPIELWNTANDKAA